MHKINKIDINKQNVAFTKSIGNKISLRILLGEGCGKVRPLNVDGPCCHLYKYSFQLSVLGILLAA